MALVSIIIPNYNHAKFLKKRLDSVFNQTFTDYEVLILDDASSDGSPEIIQQYKNHPKVSQIIINTENSGSPFKQWKKGIELVKGKFIWIAESDDYCEKNLLEELMKAFDKEEVVLSYCQSKVVDENDLVIHEDNNNWTDDLDELRWKSAYTNLGIEECKNYLSIKDTIPNTSAVVFKKEVIKKIEWNLDKFKITGDWMFWIKILHHGDISYIPQPLNYFRETLGSTRVRDTREKRLRRIKEELWILDFLKNNNTISDRDFKIKIKILFYKTKGLIPRRLYKIKREDLKEYLSIFKYIRFMFFSQNRIDK